MGETRGRSDSTGADLPGRRINSGIVKVAEAVGFEPTRALRLCWFSRPVHSTTLPRLRQGAGLYYDAMPLLRRNRAL